MTSAFNRAQRAGAVLWMLSIQYYVVQLVAAASWAKTNGYSWTNNTISDLANTQCGQYGSRPVCSPLHTAMNLSFIVLGSTMIGGALMLRAQLADNHLKKFGFGCLAVAGIGTILVGLFPENTVSSLHIIGAALPFVLGNLAMVVLGISLKQQPQALRIYTILSGVIGLTALMLFITGHYLGLGIGGMERFVSYPQSIWMITFGIYLVRNKAAN